MSDFIVQNMTCHLSLIIIVGIPNYASTFTNFTTGFSVEMSTIKRQQLHLHLQL